MLYVVLEQPPHHARDLRVLGAHRRTEVDAIEHEPAQLAHRRAGLLPCTMSPASADCSTMSCTSASIRCDPLAPSTAIGSAADPLAQQPRAHRIVDVVVDVGHPVDHPHDPPLQRLGSRARLEWRAMPSRTCSVRFSPGPSRSRLLDHPQRVLIVAKALPEALSQALVEHLLADMPERRVPEVVAEPDRLVRSSLRRSARATVREIVVTSSVCVSRVR